MGAPRAAEWLLRRVGRGGPSGLSVLGDLREEHESIRARRGRVVADLWFWAQALSVVLRLEAGRRHERASARSDGRRGRGRETEVGRRRPGTDSTSRPAGDESGPRRPRMALPAGGPPPPSRPGGASRPWPGLRQAVRGLARNPAYATFAIVALALGIAANTTVFSLVNWVLLRPVPGVQEPERLGTLRFMNDSGAMFTVPHPLWVELRERTETFEDLGAYTPVSVHLALAGGDPRRLDAEMVTGTFFDVLSLQMAAGRGFTAAEGADPDQADVVVLSHRLARELFGGAPEAVGSTLLLSGNPFVVVGVATPGFLGLALPGDTELWVPVTAVGRALPHYRLDILNDRRAATWYQMVGRLAEGVGHEEAAAEMAVLATQVAEEFGDDAWFGRLDPVLTPGVGIAPSLRARMRRAFVLMMVAVGFLLLLTCADVAHLAIARTTRRRREIAVRRALGATRGRLVGELLTESVLLGLAGGVAALGLSLGLVRLFRGSRVVSWLPELGDVGLDLRVLAFTLAVAVGSGVVFGLVPALRATRGDATVALRHVSDRHTGRLLDGLVVVQLALSLPLLVGAGLLAQTVSNLRGVEVGFEPRNVLSLSVEPAVQGYEDERSRQLYRDLVREVAALEGIEAVGVGYPAPFGGIRAGSRVARWGEDPGESGLAVEHAQVDAGFFRALGMPLLEGPGFDPDKVVADDSNRRDVVLSESLARELFPDGPAAGRQVALSTGGASSDVPYQVAGVVGDARLFQLADEPRMVAYQPVGQPYLPIQTALVVRTRSDPARLAPEARRVLAGIDPALPAFDVGTLVQRMDRTIAGQRLLARLGGAMALLAAVLATVGIFGVVSTTVRSRSRELGIRMALGADPAAVLGRVLGRTLLVGGVGIALGALGAAWMTRWLEGTLYGVSPLDPSTFVTGIAAALAITVLAALLPARQAARIDPVRTLTTE